MRKNEIASALLIKIENIFHSRPRNDEEPAETERNPKISECSSLRGLPIGI